MSAIDGPNSGHIRLVDSDLSTNPICSHGPTLLFEDDNRDKYYSCSSCRNRNDCDFYITYEEWHKSRKTDDLKDKHSKSGSDSDCKYFYDKNIKFLSRDDLKFCRNCSLIISSKDQLQHHKRHEVIHMSKRDMRCPTKLLNSLTNNKFCAQYLFTRDTKKFIVDNVIHTNGFKHVVCIGCPTIHEYIDCHKNKLNLKSILLDIDHRYKQFYSRKKFLRFNLFNNYFFDGPKAEKIFTNFVRQSTRDSIVVVMDPPFGGLVQAMANTIENISQMWRNLSNVSDESKLILTLLIFPYFNEKRITSRMPSFRISDYMVDYDNHKKFNSTASGRKFGSPVRLYTNIELSSIVLPETDGYYYCDYCLKYVSKNNKHCFECNDCTARDGKPYNHCYECRKCVKQTWNHCQSCSVCHLNQQHCTTQSDSYVTQNKRLRK